KARVVVPLLRPLLDDADTHVRAAAVTLIGEMDPEPQITPLLIGALNDRDPSVHRAAVRALSQGRSKAVPALIEALGDKAPPVRPGAAQVLSQISYVARPALKPLTEAMNDKDTTVSKWARRAVYEIEQNPSEETLKELRQLRILPQKEGR